MAYSEHLIASLSEVPDLVIAFASSIGWITDDAGTHPTLKHPTLSGATEFGIYFTSAGLEHALLVERVDSASADNAHRCRMLSPILGSPAATRIPSKLHLIGGLTPEPYIAITIEYGFNLYRHIYIGSMEKVGSYDGGEVFSASNGPLGTRSGVLNYRGFNEFLFSAHQSSQGLTAAESGGVHAVHANNPQPWRCFWGPGDPNVYTDYRGVEAIGGFADGPNDPYVARGESSFAGSAILVPINLYATRLITGDVRFPALGIPSGVRLLNMRNVEPGAEILIGAKRWKCFPHSTKEPTGNMADAGSSDRRASESSYYVGYAYLID